MNNVHFKGRYNIGIYVRKNAFMSMFTLFESRHAALVTLAKLIL